MTTQNNESKQTSGKPLNEGTSQELEELLASPSLFRPLQENLERMGFKNQAEWLDSMNADPFPMFFGQMES